MKLSYELAPICLYLALVAEVVEDGPADDAGVERGDVIVAFDNADIEEASDLPYAVAITPVGEEVDLKVMRNGKMKSIEVEVGELEEEGIQEAASEESLDLGFDVDELTPPLARNLGITDTEGLVILQVESGSPADEAGMIQGDIIVEVDQEEARDIRWLSKKLNTYEKGDTILFLIKRQGVTTYLTVKVR